MPRLNHASILLLSMLASFPADALARPLRGPDVEVARFAIRVDLDQHTVEVKSRRSILPGVKLEATLVSEDTVAHTSTLEVDVRNDSDRSLVEELRGELLSGTGELDPSGEWTIPSHLLRVGTATNTASWTLSHGDQRRYRMRVRLRAGVPLLPNEGARIESSGGVSVEVPEFALPYEALVGVEAVPLQDLVADPGDMTAVAGVRLRFEPTAVGSALPPPTKPMAVRVPEPPTQPIGSEYLVALQLGAERVAESLQDQGPEMVPQYMPVAHATLRKRTLASATDLLPGIFHGGTFALLRSSPRLWVRGLVRDTHGPRSGVVVRASNSPVIAVTDAAGRYTLAVPSVAAVVVTALDPIRGQRGVAAGGVNAGVRTVEVNVTLAPLDAGVVLRDGIRNGGFEADDLSNWSATAAVAVEVAPLVCTDGTVTPLEGTSMASVATVAPDLPAAALVQPFVIPAGARTLTFDYNVVSSEFTTGAPAPDVFVAILTTPGGDVEVARLTTTDPVATTLLGDCGDGENYAETGWRSASVDVSAYSGEPASRARLVLSVASAVDDTLPTRVFVDNFRFTTVWVDIKQLAGAAGDLARATSMVRDASAILRQAGINVRLRGYAALADPGALTDLDISLSGSGACGSDLSRQDIELTAEMSSILGYGRSSVATDINTWLVRSLTGIPGALLGYAVEDDDFCSQVSMLTNGGVFLADGVGVAGLAHEAGHVLLSPSAAGDVLEHNSAPGNFMLTNTPPSGVLTRSQSANINRLGALLLTP